MKVETIILSSVGYASLEDFQRVLNYKCNVDGFNVLEFNSVVLHHKEVEHFVLLQRTVAVP
jgi:hypothetical protein